MDTDQFGQLVGNTCWFCAIDVHEECMRPEPIGDTNRHECCCERYEVAPTAVAASGSGVRVKEPGEVTDATSTGRKRAAMLYPIFPSMVCEWSGLAKAGGGIEPIVGCNGNLIFPPTKKGGDSDTGDIHHGPDKNTLNNAPDNVHRLCRSCHHTWHSANDRYYGKRPAPDQPFVPREQFLAHDPVTRASAAELALANAGRTATNPRTEDPHSRGVVSS